MHGSWAALPHPKASLCKFQTRAAVPGSRHPSTQAPGPAGPPCLISSHKKENPQHCHGIYQQKATRLRSTLGWIQITTVMLSSLPKSYRKQNYEKESSCDAFGVEKENKATLLKAKGEVWHRARAKGSLCSQPGAHGEAGGGQGALAPLKPPESLSHLNILQALSWKQ